MAKVFVEPKANEAYVADGYFNRRVAVLDAATGKMKRFWGAYGNRRTTRSTLAATIRRRRPPNNSATRFTAPTSRTTGSSTSAIA